MAPCGDMAVQGPAGILVVEDNHDIRMLIRLSFRMDPRLEVSGEAVTASQALQLATGLRPALIILDQRLRDDTSGLDVAPLLKAAAPGTKILLFSAFDLRREAASSESVDAVLRKDNIRELLPTAQRMLRLGPARPDRASDPTPR